MTPEEQGIVKKLETRVRQLILQDKDLQEKNMSLFQQVAKCNEQMAALKEENQKLSAQYANLKMARMLEISDSDTRDARRRLAKLVRDVDKCIAMLKA